MLLLDRAIARLVWLHSQYVVVLRQAPCRHEREDALQLPPLSAKLGPCLLDAFYDKPEQILKGHCDGCKALLPIGIQPGPPASIKQILSWIQGSGLAALPLSALHPELRRYSTHFFKSR